MALDIRAGGASEYMSQLGLGASHKPSLALCTSFAGLSQEEVAQTSAKMSEKRFISQSFLSWGFYDPLLWLS